MPGVLFPWWLPCAIEGVLYRREMQQPSIGALTDGEIRWVATVAYHRLF